MKRRNVTIVCMRILTTEERMGENEYENTQRNRMEIEILGKYWTHGATRMKAPREIQKMDEVLN